MHTMIKQEPRSIPGPPASPLFGEKLNLLAFNRDPVTFLQNLHHRFGDIAALTQNNRQYIFVFNPAYNRTVLSDAKRFQVVELPFSAPANSALARLFTIPGQMNGPASKRQRQAMYAALHSRFHGRFSQNLVRYTSRFLDRWQPNQPIDLFQEMIRLETASPCTTLFDIDPDGDGREIVHELHRWGRSLLASSTRLFPLALPGSSYHRLLKSSEHLESAYRRLIQHKRTAGLQDDPLSVLIKWHDDGALNEAELIGQVNNLFNAGNTSRATVLTWVLFLLAQFPEILAEVADEATAVLNHQPPQAGDIPKLLKLRAVLDETMRLLPPMNWFSRRVMEPTQIVDYCLPAGALVIVSPFITQRLHDIYPDPHQFLPERWHLFKPDPFAYLPFGAGPRHCTGREVATLEMLTVLTLILQRFRLPLQPAAVINRAGMMLSAPQKMPMVVQPADYPLRSYPARGNINQIISFKPGEKTYENQQ